MFIQTTCPCCDCKTKKLSAFFSQFVIWRTTKTKPKLNIPTTISHCTNCDFYYSTVRFNEKEMVNLYNGYRDDIYNSMRLECEPNYQTTIYSNEYIHLRKRFIQAIITEHTALVQSVLDYGGGDGIYIPDIPCKYVYDISGTNAIKGVTKYDLSENQKFDLVMNCQVLEHLSNLNHTLEILKALSKKYLYIEVPAYKDPPPKDIIIGEHINFFNKSSLHALLNKHNISIIDTRIDYDLKILAVIGKL